MATKMAQPDSPIPIHSPETPEFQQAPPRERFPKRDRLLKRPAFLRLSRHGKKIHTRLFLAAALPGETPQTRLGVTITRKVGSAVRRNRIKRLVREFFRLNSSQVPQGLDINVIAKKEAADAEAEQIRSSLKELFGQIRGRVSSKR